MMVIVVASAAVFVDAEFIAPTSARQQKTLQNQ
jgi:hypothetical protein